jgi:hypothetical protein
MSKATEDELDKLHGALASQLAEKIKSGEATAADMAVARQFLKDNGIQSLPRPKSGLGELADSLPFADADEIADERSLLN